MQTFFRWFLVFALTICTPGAALAIDESSGLGMTIPDTAYNKVSVLQTQPQAARVRIPLHLTPFEKMVFKDKNGVYRTRFKPAGLMLHTLRARIERPNHFYVGSWHIETTPLKWEKERRHYEVKLSFYRRYGDGRELEEFLGSTEAKGVLEGKDHLFVFRGHSKIKLRNRNNEDVLEVVIGDEKANGLTADKNLNPSKPYAKKVEQKP